jgi:hypothetical protein
MRYLPLNARHLLAGVAALTILSTVLTDASVQKRPSGQKQAAVSSVKTGYAVLINQPQSNLDVVANPLQKPLIVIVFCNATIAPKDVEGWVGDNSPVTVQNLVASTSGTSRQTITFVVPWGWYYYINVAQQPGGGIPPGGKCQATAWWTD